MAPEKNEQWIFKSRPTGEASHDNFEIRFAEKPVPGPGQVLVRNIYLMVPASMRLWMNEKPTYFPPQPIGQVMNGGTLAVVEASNAPGFTPGMYVNTFAGWQTYAVMPPEQLIPVKPHPKIELAAYRSVLDVQGLTAYAGLVDLCDPKPGDTLVVTAAAGSVGSLACQIGKNLGATVIGVAGGEKKCAWLKSELGCDAAIDYKHDDVAAKLKQLAPNGVSCVFENVGGPVFDAILGNLARHARIALCGLVAGYNDDVSQTYKNFTEVIFKSARIEGFLVLDFLARAPEIIPKLEQWILDGKLKYELDYSDGLATAVTAMQKLSRGQNKGMGIVRISPER
ncbi:MAG TPA: NADP-dependent oxidoreductase [Nevskiaceae bacterium]|nr:NADP-dependent oxidoreductase [Nevskiaceae bacterium]